jgi:hypothetical protein
VTGLQEAFYIVGLIYMSISLVAMIAILIVIGVIRHKVVSLEKIVKERLEPVTNLGSHVTDIIDAVRSLAGRSK